jgi:hypothetical protein
MAARKKEVVRDPAVPVGLREKGTDLWVRITDQYDFSAAPEKLLLLEEAARAADMVARLQSIVDGLDDWRVRGSQGQPVQAPEVSSLLSWRAQFASLIEKLRLPDEDDGSGSLTRSQIGRRAAQARWGNRG